MISLFDLRCLALYMNVLSSTVGLRCEAKVGVQHTSVATTTGSDLNTGVHPGIGEDDIFTVGECIHCAIVILVDEGNNLFCGNKSFLSAHSECERTVAVDLLIRSSHLNDGDFVNNLDRNSFGDRWFNFGFDNANKASMDGQWVASL